MTTDDVLKLRPELTRDEAYEIAEDVAVRKLAFPVDPDAAGEKANNLKSKAEKASQAVDLLIEELQRFYPRAKRLEKILQLRAELRELEAAA